MNWAEFRDKLGKIQFPNADNGFIEKFIIPKNSIHLVTTAHDPKDLDLEIILSTVNLLEERGAKRCDDYIITSTFKITGDKYSVDTITIHTIEGWLSDEDFVGIKVIKNE